MTARVISIGLLALTAGALAGCESYSQPFTVAAEKWYNRAKILVTGEKPDTSGRGFIVRQVGSDLEETDATLIATTAAMALEAEPSGRSVRWNSPETEASARIVPGKTVMERRTLKFRRAKGIAEAPLSTVIGRVYTARRPVNLRTGPGTGHAVIRLLDPGEAFTAIARVANGRWVMIGGGDQAVGYVFGPLIKPAQASAATVHLRDPGVLVTHDFDTDLAENETKANMTVDVPCRTLKYTVRTRSDNPRKNRFRACKAGDGAWDIATPMVADAAE